MNCTDKNKYISENGRCCDRCPAGSYMKAECDGTEKTKCDECEPGFYTATKNNLRKCHVCKQCSSSYNQRTVTDCRAKHNTVCQCVTGFYCSDNACDHCQPVTSCRLGKGVKVLATQMNDTVCAPCEEGTYSNVTDFHSPCQKHTRCEDFRRVLETPGTKTTDAICGDFKTDCHWMLPAGLWSGLVLTALVLFGLICWREKRKSSRTVSSSVPVKLIEMVPAERNSLLDLPLPSTELKGYCQESCIVNGCELPPFNSDDIAVSDGTHDSMDSCRPITPLKVTVSFAESSNKNGSVGYYTSNFQRTFSEPQEDEWCGT
ncbi:tumor necrosis factor receptor superfamily member 5 [Dicentrarchus labrax]|uniref:TNFR-Cys domain-containing protein n=1 Tax=Dicentrarchus labrax TaxID=13489 RepID=A0A8P4FVS8_DICLA|nr:tumor necrosis factor receptor superfamily member 5 [Dicentrarchus labrax]